MEAYSKYIDMYYVHYVKGTIFTMWEYSLFMHSLRARVCAVCDA